MVNSHEEEYDRAKELKQFDDTKTGVKGLVDSGISSIPRFFHHPPHTLSDLKPDPKARQASTPTIDLAGVNSDRRAAIVRQVSRAAREVGFFQIVNHGIPPAVLDCAIAAVKAFHEQPAEAKVRFYGGNRTDAVSYKSNYDLYRSEAADWRDSLSVILPPEPDKLPEVCRDALVEWDREVSRLEEVVIGWLEEGLGLCAGRLRESVEWRMMVGQYYPHCPEPYRTVGIKSHTDLGVLTILTQNHLGGLQIKSGGQWVDVKPISGALVVNIGDLLQIMSNDEYQSVEHRVLANSCQEARVSVGVFLHPKKSEKLYGPLPELICSEKPARYQHFTFLEYINIFSTNPAASKSLKNYFKK